MKGLVKVSCVNESVSDIFSDTRVESICMRFTKRKYYHMANTPNTVARKADLSSRWAGYNFWGEI